MPVGIQLPSIGSGSMKFLKWPNFVFQYMTVKRQSEDDRRAARRWLASRTSEAGWRPVLVFPEGTNTNGKAIIQFKGGAFSVIYFYSFGPGQGCLWLIEFVVSLPCTQEFFKPNRSCCNCSRLCDLNADRYLKGGAFCPGLLPVSSTTLC